MTSKMSRVKLIMSLEFGEKNIQTQFFPDAFWEVGAFSLQVWWFYFAIFFFFLSTSSLSSTESVLCEKTFLVLGFFRLNSWCSWCYSHHSQVSVSPTWLLCAFTFPRKT